MSLYNILGKSMKEKFYNKAHKLWREIIFSKAKTYTHKKKQKCLAGSATIDRTDV